MRNITGLDVVHRTPVAVGCGWVKVVFVERCCVCLVEQLYGAWLFRKPFTPPTDDD